MNDKHGSFSFEELVQLGRLAEHSRDATNEEDKEGDGFILNYPGRRTRNWAVRLWTPTAPFHWLRRVLIPPRSTQRSLRD